VCRVDAGFTGPVNCRSTSYVLKSPGYQKFLGTTLSRCKDLRFPDTGRLLSSLGFSVDTAKQPARIRSTLDSVHRNLLCNNRKAEE